MSSIWMVKKANFQMVRYSNGPKIQKFGDRIITVKVVKWAKQAQDLKNTKSLYSSALVVGATDSDAEAWPTTEGTTEPRVYPEPWKGLTEAWKWIKINNLPDAPGIQMVEKRLDTKLSGYLTTFKIQTR